MSSFYSSQIYRKSPIFLQNSFVTAKGLLHEKFYTGKRFNLLQREIIQNEKTTSAEMRELQLAKLKEILNYAYEYVPYYKKSFDRLGFSPSHIADIDDIKDLPFLDKQIIRDQFEELIPLNFRKRLLFKKTTSGTTGSPLAILMNREVIQSEHAFIARQYRWAGCSDKGRIASFRGDIIVPVEQIKLAYWRYNRCSRELLFSSYHLSDDTIAKYLGRLNKFDPELIYAYPSFIFLLAKYAKKNSVDILLPSLRGIVTSSETLFDYQKKLIEEVFHSRVFNWYGLSERVIFIGTCERGGHHVFPDYGLTEFIPLPGSEKQGLFELVGTSFINKVMPLIRYRTGDMVTLISEPCECGRSFSRVRSIVGRSNDAIVTPEGRTILMVDDVFKDIENIKLAQIVQKKIDEIDILVEPEATFNIVDEERIIKNMRLRIGEKINISVNRVIKIPRMPSNKYKLIVSNLGDKNHNSLSNS